MATNSKRGSAATSMASKSGKGTATYTARKPLVRHNSSFSSAIQDMLNDPQNVRGTNSKAPRKPTKSGYEGKKAKQTVAPKIGNAPADKVEYDKNLTKKFNDMLDGDMTDLPPLPKSMVRLFLSSTFSDMREERNILIRRVYPHLTKFCIDQGLDFQVVDMRWGVDEESTNDHSVEKLCLLEVENCQKASRGPNFVFLSGDRYGFRPIPTEIAVKEFENLRFEATRLNIPDRELLNEWYKLDENAVPPEYILQPIRSKFTFFGDHSPGCDEPRKKDTADWWKTFEQLQKILRQCADSAHKNGKMSTERRHEYFNSVTESEIQAGILQADNVADHTLMYRREFRHLAGPALSEENASRHIDTVKDSAGISQINEECMLLREDLTENKIPQKLEKSSIKHYTVLWKPGGIDPNKHKDHKEYLEKFCKDFIAGCVELIKRAKISRIQMSNYYSDYDETIHHLHFCETKCQFFCGQEKVLARARNYILDESARKPYIIHAKSGAGKTSIMAMIMKDVSEWLKGRSHVKLIRFLGTTPHTTNIYDVLFSVCGQLADAANLIMAPVSYRTMKNLVEYIPRYFRTVATALKEPVIILLDSIDQLSSAHRAYGMEWLPTLLPPNFKLILSTLPEEHGILANLRKLLPDPECYVEVPPIPDATGREIMKVYMDKHKRRLTETQANYLLSLFQQAPTPLFLKLLLDEAKKWRSFTRPSELVLLMTVTEAIHALFGEMEKKFGKQLLASALGFITVGLNGLSEVEIEDALSCDDRVLDEVYKYHDPPVTGVVHVPPVLWARIHYDIKEYLVERMSYGKNTLNWYHRQFFETARAMYTTEGKDKELHKILTEVYLADDGVHRTITLSQRKNLVVTDADRQVTPQPFNVHNRRKLACLPYHVIHAGSRFKSDLAKSEIFCNFKFLSTCIAAFSVSQVLEYCSQYVDISNDYEVTVLMNFLSISKDDLRSPVRFAVSLLANIQPETSDVHLKNLLHQAEEHLLAVKHPLLIPAFAGLAQRYDSYSSLSSSLKSYSELLSWGSDSVLMRTASPRESTEDQKAEFVVFNSVTQDLHQINLPHSLKDITPKLSWSGKTMFFVSDTSLVAQDVVKDYSQKFDFDLMLPEWKENQISIVGFETNGDTSLGVALFSNSSLACVNLNEMVKVAGFTFKNQPVKASRAFCSNSDTEPEILVLGTIENSLPEDTQGPENQYSISKFVLQQEHPLMTLESTKIIDPKLATFLNENGQFVVGASMQGIYQLLRVNMQPFKFLEPAIDLPHPVTQLQGNSTKPVALALTFEGKVLQMDILKGSITLEVEVNNPIVSFDVLWDDQLALLGSGKGVITVYDLDKDKHLGGFPAHSAAVQEICVLDEQCITLGKNHEMKSWSVKGLTDDMKKGEKADNKRNGDNIQTLLAQKYLTAIGISKSGNEVVTCTEEGFVRIWSASSFALLRQYSIEMAATLMYVTSDGHMILLDQTTGKLKVLDLDSGKNMVHDVPKNVATFTTNAKETRVITVCAPKKGKVVIEVIDLKQGKVIKTIAVQKELRFESVEAVLSPKEQYVVLRIEISDEEFNSIAAMWKKQGSFQAQNHQFRFTAIDLAQGTGGQNPCYRLLSKIPVLGERMEPQEGNVMMITTRRWVVFWDIPTGKCDQRTSRADKKGMMYRPSWLGQDCKGTSLAFRQSPNKEFVAIGSEDGYLFIYNSESGSPRGLVKPETRHNAEVTILTISPDSKWVVSACRNCIIKLWDSATGNEQFSFRVDAEVQCLMFTSQSDRLLIYTGSQTTRMLIFKLHVGK